MYCCQESLAEEGGEWEQPILDKLPQDHSAGHRNQPYKVISQTSYFHVPFLQHLGGTWKLACQHRVLPSMQCLQCLHLGCKRTPPRAGFHRLCPWPGAGVCHQAGWPGLLSSQGFTRVFIRQECLTTAHLQSEPLKSSLTQPHQDNYVGQWKVDTEQMHTQVWCYLCSPGLCLLWQTLWKGQDLHKPGKWHEPSWQTLTNPLN